MNHHDANLFVADTVVKLRGLAHEIIDRPGRFRAGKSAARDHEGEPLATRGGVFLQRRFFQKRHHAISQQRRVAKIFHRHRPIANAGIVEKVCLRTEREQQMVELELKLGAVKSMRASEPSAR